MVACGHKPNSVPPRRSLDGRGGDDHSSGAAVTDDLEHATRPRPIREPADYGRAARGGPEGCLRLHAVGFAVPWLSPAQAVRSYRTFSPLPPEPGGTGGGVFSVALSLARDRGRWALPTTVSCRVRTFLRPASGTAIAYPRGHHTENVEVYSR